MAVGSDARLYVLEGQERQVRVFDHAGRLVTVFGRRGAGPGELEDPYDFGILGDTVWISELSGNRRLTMFRTDGTLLGTVPAPSTSFVGGQGNVVAHLAPASLRPGGVLQSQFMYSAWGADTVFLPKVHFNLKGEITDTIGWDTVAIGGSGPTIRIAGVTAPPPGRPIIFFDQPLETADGRLRVERPLPASGERSTFTVTRFDGAGDTLWSRSYSYRPKQPDPAQIESAVASAGEVFRFRGGDSAVVDREIRDVLDLPTFLPPVTNARIVDGEVWLRRESTGGERAWIIIDGTGNARARIILPREFSPRVYGAREVWGVYSDEFDVPWVVRYSIHGG